MRHLLDGAQNDGDGRASGSIDIGGCTVSGQRCWKLDTARPQHEDGGGNAPAYAQGFHKIENGPPWLILCNRVAVARNLSFWT
jgi:hypothetical protein